MFFLSLQQSETTSKQYYMSVRDAWATQTSTGPMYNRKLTVPQKILNQVRAPPTDFHSITRTMMMTLMENWRVNAQWTWTRRLWTLLTLLLMLQKTHQWKPCLSASHVRNYLAQLMVSRFMCDDLIVERGHMHVMFAIRHLVMQ